MMNTLKYKGYTARVEFDSDDKIFFGRVLDIADVIGFHGATVDELIADFQAAIDDYLAVCEEEGQVPNKPFSGQVLLRIAPDLHRSAVLAANRLGKSLNSFLADAVAAATKSAKPRSAGMPATKKASGRR